MKKFINIFAVLLAVLLILPVGAQAAQLIPGGQLIGLELCNNTVTVAAFDKTGSVAQTAGLQVGDRITHINKIPVCNASDIKTALSRTQGMVRVDYQRKGQARSVEFQPDMSQGNARLGIYLKQGITGVGTVTFYDPDTGNFGALGHCVNDQSGKILKMSTGNAFDAHVMAVKKGKSGTPGQLMGAMDVQYFGSLSKNTPQGVFGKTETPVRGDALETASAKDVHTGTAIIRSTVENNGVQDYSVKILKIYPASRTGGRNMLIKVTDPALLQATGGIVQGMSGSPIIQDGKLVGAVTHVLVNDPTRGYGIFIENMLDAAA